MAAGRTARSNYIALRLQYPVVRFTHTDGCSLRVKSGHLSRDISKSALAPKAQIAADPMLPRSMTRRVMM
jgi:hypothetical protein